MINKLKQHKLILIIFIIGIILMVTGTTYSFYKIKLEGQKQHIVSSDVISFTYKESEDKISITNMNPISDTKGKKNNYFEFKVLSKLKENMNIKYIVSLSKIDIENSFEDNDIKMYLTDGNDNELISPTIISLLEENKKIKDSKIIYANNFIHNEQEQTHTYRIRIWLKENVDMSKYTKVVETETGTNVSLEQKTYKFKINVNTIESMDTSGANKPILASNMIPVYYDETNDVWKKADKDNSQKDYRWYSYESSGEYKGMWANAVTVKDTNRQTYLNATPGTTISMDDINTMWVWIPRFKVNTTDFTLIRGKDSGYCLEDGEGRTTNTKEECEKLGPGIYWVSHYKNPGAIDITFVKENDKAIDSFTFGTKELSGFWYAKFATSHSTLSSSTTDNNLGCTNETCSNANGIIIKPNVTSLRYNNISNFFYASRSMEQTENSFGFVSSEVDTHMSKNNKWGTVAYLTHSIYGRCNNSTNCVNVSRSSNEVYNTTSGKDTSTTGTIYGVYNMNDGKREYVMGVLADTNGNPRSGDDSSQTSGFTGMEYNGTMYTGVPFPDSKYYNLYSGNYYEESAQIGSKYIGHALKETDSWYGERIGYMQSTPLSNMYPWVLRNWNLGMFNVWHTSGYYYNSMADSSYSSARFVITNE